jgi:hypothetical protein
MKRFFLVLLIILIPGIFLFAQESKENTGTLPKDTNLHFTGKYCLECHEEIPEKGEDRLLKFNGDFTQLCRCHGYTPGTYIHPVFVEPSPEKLLKIPDSFPLADGMISCVTCHDIYMQCQDETQETYLNRRFLRGAPYISRTSLCFRCHDEKKYKMLDPHNQLTRRGKVIIEKCLYCHVDKPDERHETFEDVKLIGNLEVLCYRCHFKQSRMHPINAEHLLIPSEKIRAMMKESEKNFGIILPLNYDGKITCPTCHNPHERGVIPGNKASSKGASEKFRLRLTRKNLTICVACHKDKFEPY